MSPGALDGLRVLDVSTLFAGPFAARMLADHGAEVTKIECPAGDPLRRFGHQVAGVSMTWKVLNRNKSTKVLDLHLDADQEGLRLLAADADVVIENFRPGVLAGWGLGYEQLSALNPRVIVVSVTAFGQDGPYAARPGFGTVAEAMSGLAAMSGLPGGEPLLPSFPLGDAVAGMHAAFAALAAIRARGETGIGQHVDVAILDALIDTMGAQVPVYALTGAVPVRQGNGSASNAPRNVYACAGGAHVALSAPTTEVAGRVMRAVGAPALAEEGWFRTGAGRAEHREVIDAAIGEWTARRSRTEVVQVLSAARAAVGPVYEMPDLVADEHIRRRGTLVTVPDEQVGPILMPGPAIRFSRTPGTIRHAGPSLPCP